MSGTGRAVRSGEQRSGSGFLGRGRILGIEAKAHPVRTPELHRVLRPVGAISTPHGVGGTELLAPPADALGVPGMLGELSGHKKMLPAATGRRLDIRQGTCRSQWSRLRFSYAPRPPGAPSSSESAARSRRQKE